MSQSCVLLTQKINRLREIDGVLDLSKSTLQLEIAVLLISRGRLTTFEIAKQLNQRKKAITDALRKLRLKGLIVEEEVNGDKLYRLSKDGEYYLRSLIDAADLKQLQQRATDTLNPMESKGVILRNLAVAFYVHESIVALGTSKRRRLPLKDLAKLVSLSQERLQTYLDLFSEGGACLFRKYYVPTMGSKILTKLGLKKRTTKTVYALTDQALQIFYRLPIYAKARSTLAIRLLRPLLRNGHPKEVLIKLLKLLITGNFFALLLWLITQNAYPALSACWLAISTLIGGITLLDFYLFNRL